MAITYAAGTITVSTPGVGLIGSTLALAYVMQDVIDADVVGGWGVTHKQGNNQYKIDCNIIIGGQSLATYFKFIKEDILFCGELFQIGGGTMPWHYYPGRVYFGEMVNGEPVNGSTFTFGYIGGAGETKLYSKAETLHLYNSQLKTITAVPSKLQIANAGALTLNRSIIDGVTDPFYEVVSAWQTDMDDSVIQNANIGIYMEDASKRLVLNKLIFKNCNTGLYNFGMGGITTLLNLKTINTPLLVDVNTSGWTLRLINPDIETWHVNLAYTNTYIYRAYELYLKVIDSNNVVIPGVATRVWDLPNDVAVVMNTETSGKLVDSGTATSGNNTTLFDTSKAWTIDAYKGFLIKIINGTGVGQIRGIENNTATGIKIGSGFLNHWKTNPDNTSEYEILPTLEYGYLSFGNGDIFTMKTPHILKMYKYGKKMLPSKFEIAAAIDWVLTMYDNNFITEASEAVVAAYTGITVNHTSGTITISENHTMVEIYDYLQYDIKENPQLDIDETISTADGVNFTGEYNFIINTGITVTAANKKLTMVAGKTYTLNGTANFTGIIADSTKTRVPVILSGVVDGSRYRIEKTSDGSMVYEGTQSGVGDIINYYEHTADLGVTIKVRKSNPVDTRYYPVEATGTITDTGFSLTISQEEDGQANSDVSSGQISLNATTKIISIETPKTEVTIQELVNSIRDWEDELTSMGHAGVIDTEGKADLGGGVETGIVITLNVLWQVQFYGSSGYTTIKGGTLVGGVGSEPVKATGTAGDLTIQIQPTDATITTSNTDVIEEGIEDIKGTGFVKDVDSLTNIKDAVVITSSSINDATPASNSFNTNLTETVDDFWNRGALIFTSGQNKGVIRKIQDYTGFTKRIELRTNLSYTPVNGDTFNIIPIRCFRTNYNDVTKIVDDIWNEPFADHTDSLSFGGMIMKRLKKILWRSN